MTCIRNRGEINLSMCRETIPLAGRHRPREVLSEGTWVLLFTAYVCFICHAVRP